MDPEILNLIVIVLSVIVVVAVVSRLILRHALRPENIPAETQNDPFEPPITTQAVRATVVDQSCEAKLLGTKTPKATKIFTVVFRTEEGKTLSLNVPEEMYDGFERGQTGLLTLVDGELYGFAPEA